MSSATTDGTGEPVDGTGAQAEVTGEPVDGEDLGLEERLRRLERILTSLEADDHTLDRALELFEEGVGHVRAAEKLLGEATLKVEELLDGDGNRRALDTDDA